MSLSQKHAGKVLVPWFNKAEWKLVYDLIYSDNQNWLKALEILKIWKQRTPLLSAGVEGTLIILEALLVNTSQLSPYEISHIFSTSLVRFLNLCAANSDKQGTFYKTAMKNELPKWLISIRHDIAHSHKIPSQSMLEISLKFCLEWLKGKYWDVQYDNINDFIVGNVDNAIVEDSVYIYEKFKGVESQLTQKLMRRINRVVGKGKQVGSENVIEKVDEALSIELRKNKEISGRKLCNLLVENLVILKTELEVDDSGRKKIPESFLKRWNNLIDILNETEILPRFVIHLFSFTCNEGHNNTYREVASLWIKEIFQALINKDNDIEIESSLHFSSKSICMENKDFVDEILKELTPFTLNFLTEVLQYNNCPMEFIEDCTALVTAFMSQNRCKTDRIHTIEDLNIIEEILQKEKNADENKRTVNESSRWKRIEDTTPYMNLPLGILPHQDLSNNPVLII